jgi:sialic acid synthase SpsE
MATKLNDLELTPGRLVGEGHPAFIIAEIGQNHQGTDMFNLCHFLSKNEI